MRPEQFKATWSGDYVTGLKLEECKGCKCRGCGVRRQRGCARCLIPSYEDIQVLLQREYVWSRGWRSQGKARSLRKACGWLKHANNRGGERIHESTLGPGRSPSYFLPIKGQSLWPTPLMSLSSLSFHSPAKPNQDNPSCCCSEVETKVLNHDAKTLL